MSLKKLVLLFGLFFLISACSSGLRYEDQIKTANEPHVTPTQMGVRYLLGRGVTQDNKKAFDYFLQAANNDDAFAQNEVAYLFAAGKGTPRNDTKAFYYYQKAAQHGLSSAEYNLGLFYIHGLGTEVNKSVGQEWIERAAAHGFEPAKQFLTKS